MRTRRVHSDCRSGRLVSKDSGNGRAADRGTYAKEEEVDGGKMVGDIVEAIKVCPVRYADTC